MPRRYYSSTAARTTLSASVNSSVTSLTVVAVSGWPSSFPYTLIIDQDTVNEEIVEVTNRSGTTLTVVRGVDGTTAVSHSAGAAVNHGVSARDFNEPNAFLNEGGTVTGATAVEANSSSAALRVTNTGTGNSLVVEDSANPDATPFVVDASGNVGIGTSSPARPLDVRAAAENVATVTNTTDASFSTVKTRFTAGTTNAGIADLIVQRQNSTSTDFILSLRDSGGTVTDRVRVTGAGNVGIGTNSPASLLHLRGSAQISQTMDTISSDANGSQIAFIKYRGTPASPTVVSSGDVIGNLLFQGYDGASLRSGALIRATVDGTPGSADMPGALLFFTTPDGSATLSERMRIDSAGNVGIGGTPTQLLDVIGGASDVAARIRNGAGLVDLTVQAGGNFRIVHNTAGASIRMVAGGAERFIVDSAGLITGSGTSLGAWTAYTPTLGGTGWDIGDGTIAGAYCQIGKVVFFRAIVTFGSTSTFGAAAAPRITLPVTAATGSVAQNAASFGALYTDTSAGLAYNGVVLAASATVVEMRIPGASGVTTVATATTPFTWASTDTIVISGTYQIA